jgi:AcrR family transcriptional regulator
LGAAELTGEIEYDPMHFNSRRNYAKIQVKDVAEAAGVSLGTLYRYFSSKDHLFACALTNWAAPVEAALAARRRRSRGAPATRVRTIFHAAALSFEDAPHVYGALMALAVSADRYAIAEFQAFSQRELVFRAPFDSAPFNAADPAAPGTSFRPAHLGILMRRKGTGSHCGLLGALGRWASEPPDATANPPAATSS